MAASISGLSSNLATSQTSAPSGGGTFAAFRSDFQQLRQALQSGNLSGAQTAFANLAQLIPAGAQNGPLATALGKVGQALQAGNLAAAHQAFIPALKALENAVDQHHAHQIGVSGGAPSVGGESGVPAPNGGGSGIGSVAQGAANALNLLNVLA